MKYNLPLVEQPVLSPVLACTIRPIRTGNGGSLFLESWNFCVPSRCFCFTLLELISWKRFAQTCRPAGNSREDSPPSRIMVINWIKELRTEWLWRFSETSPSKLSSLARKSLHTILAALLSPLSFSSSDRAHDSNKPCLTSLSTVRMKCLPLLAAHRPGILI